MRIGSIGTGLSTSLTTPFRYSADLSILDFDLVLYDPATVLSEYKSKQGGYKGETCLDQLTFERLSNDVLRRNREFDKFFSLGRTLVLFAPKRQTWYHEFFTGSGIVHKTSDVRAFLPKPVPLKLETASGNQIKPRANAKLHDFCSEWIGRLQYRAVILEPPGEPQLVISGTEKVVATIVKAATGHSIVLPTITDPNHVDAQRFIESLLTVVANLKQTAGDFELPPWTADYQLHREQELRSALAKLEQERDALLARLDDRKDELAHVEQYKLLFTGTGKALEIVVRRALETLGFSVEEGPSGRDDLIARYKDKVAVVEVKGTSKSASERHAAQLEKWVSEHLSAHGVQPKGILIVNAFRDVPLDDRTEAAFPDQMLPYSARRQHCLLTGMQLLGLVLECERAPDKKESLVEELLNTDGVLAGFQNWREYLSAS